jgi:Domain of unknown function (DUF4440)
MENLMRTGCVVIVCGLLVGCGGTGAPSLVAKDKFEIRKVLDDQETCWNSGDLEGFMRGYWKSEELTFQSGDKVTKGWQATFDRYKKKYQSDGAEMGELKFSNVVVTPIALGSSASVTGDWHLTIKDGKTPHGSFKLLLDLKPDGWKIVRDETTSAE